MKLNEDEAAYLRKELLLGFHTQFAENQRAREDAFMKLLAFLAALLAGYAVVLQGVLG